MSKSVGKVFGFGSPNTYGYEQNYMNYLNNYDTANYDNTLANMSNEAFNMSNNLASMPQYQFMIDGSDEARKRAEEATYKSYVDKLEPQYQQSQNDLQNNLINKGIPVGSEAYNRAMQNLYDSHNEALNQAAYSSVLNGQRSYTQSLSDSAATANFSNSARHNYIDQIKALLDGSVSGYNKARDLYSLQNGVKQRQNEVKETGWNNLGKVVGSVASLF